MYSTLAEFYDLFMEEGEWADFAFNAVIGKGRGADVGCGSGIVTLKLAEAHDVVAIDPSPEMLKKAKERFSKAGLNIPVVMQRAEKLSLPFKADFITAMCDVVNYIKQPVKFFEAAFDNMSEGGILVFDISSEKKLRRMGGKVFTDVKDDVTYVWENRLGKNSIFFRLTFFVPTQDGLYKREIEEQTQYIHTREDIVSSLKSCGFKVTKIKTAERGDRIFFVAAKAGL